MAKLGPAVFLDRDGTVIEERDYLADPAGVELLPGAADAISRLNRADLPVIVVTNQSGIGRGLLTEEDYAAVHERMVELLGAAGAWITAAYHCPHAPDHFPPCECRKPEAGLFRRAAAEHGVDLARSAFIGDRLRDVLPGVLAGGQGFLLPGTDLAESSEIPSGIVVVDSLADAVGKLLPPHRTN